MKNFIRLSKSNRVLKRLHKDEQGVSLVISLLMGVILITGATGLLIRQLTAKKLASSESYQQMAETAASNGFNRILAVLNNASTSEYRGFLFTENNNPNNDWLWQQPYSKGQFCSGLSGLPDYRDANGKTAPEPDANGNPTLPWPASETGYKLNEETLRGDNIGDVVTSYRLRSYNSTYSEGKGEGTFEVEGFVRRVQDDEESVLARARLTRSLQLKSGIARPQDWGVLAAQSSNALGGGSGTDITINGPGRFVWFTQSANTDLCNQSFTSIQGEITQVVWPILRGADTAFIPASSAYSRDKSSFDSVSINSNQYYRVWTIDDTASSCGFVVCTSPGENGSLIRADITANPSLTINEEDNQDPASGQADIDYKTFQRSNGYFRIGTCKDNNNPEANCRSDDTNSNFWQWSSWKTWRSGIPGRTIKRWRWKDQQAGIKEIGTCNRSNASQCKMNRNNHWTWQQVATQTDNINDDSTSTDTPKIVKIDSSDICQDNDSGDCHLYIQRLNLTTNTNIFIKNDTRAVVLHLNVDDSVSLGNETYFLGSGSKLCGVNSLANRGSEQMPSCNLDPVRLVITQDGDTERRSCPTVKDAKDFGFEGNSLPAAWVSMNTGRVRTQDVQTRGVIWASSLCSEGDLTVTSQDSDGNAYVEQAKDYWNFGESEGVGRRIVRGIRGSGFDIFKRW
ncbi:hypothetical protein KR100_12145 [Synechococcus sp. KORDI-100]|uniref:hypothetical protein n=1 Tax=Synechococcus sp. KORDI-100 TaxID=1280380 RepID=UPI0004E03717|nr:hypothetical protein [Synechococcus sp. KORDI-100]AII44101.1 hypothetical protein KR100_12145 [Synechococcus sp. KORDI-100]